MGRKPVRQARIIVRTRYDLALGIEIMARENADLAVERLVRQLQLEINPRLGNDLVPAAHTARRVTGIIVAQAHVDRRQRRHFALYRLAVHHVPHDIGVALQHVVVIDPVLLIPPLDARVERVGGVGRNLLSEQVQAKRVMQVQLLLDQRQVDHPQTANAVGVVGVGDAMLVHHLAGALDRAAHSGFTHEHVVRLFGQHETAGAA